MQNDRGHNMWIILRKVYHKTIIRANAHWGAFGEEHMKKILRHGSMLLIFTLLFNALMAPITFASSSEIYIPPDLAAIQATPYIGQTDVYANTPIIITFNQAIHEGEQFSEIVLTDDAMKVQNIHCTLSGDTLTVVPEDMAYGAHFLLTVPAEAIEGLNAAALTSDYTLDFKTRLIITGSSPEDLSTDIDRNASIAVTFSNTVLVGAAINDIRIFPSDHPETPVALASIKLAASGDGTFSTLTIKGAAALEAFTDYSVVIPAGAVMDSEGNALQADYTFCFRTAQTYPPEVLLTTPLAGADDVSADSTIDILFTTSIQAGTAFSQIALKDVDSGAAIAASLKIDQDTLSVCPVGSLTPGTQYQLNIPEDAVANVIDSQFFNAALSLAFTTAGPILQGTSPADGETKNGIDIAPALYFNQPITGIQLSDIILENDNGVRLGTDCLIDGDTLIVVPEVLLEANTTYTVIVPEGTISTLSGTVNSDYAFSFSTRDAIDSIDISGASLGDYPLTYRAKTFTKGVSGILKANTAADRYLWDFGNGDTTTTSKGLYYTFNETGSFDVRVVQRMPQYNALSKFYVIRQTITVISPSAPDAEPSSVVFNPETAVLKLTKNSFVRPPSETAEFDFQLTDSDAPVAGQKIDVYAVWESDSLKGVAPKHIGTLRIDNSGYTIFKTSLPAGAPSGSAICYSFYIGDYLKATGKLTCEIKGTSSIGGFVQLKLLNKNAPPPSGAIVSIDNDAQETALDSYGFFMFSNLVPGLHSISVKVPGWNETGGFIHVDANDSAWEVFTVDSVDESKPVPVINRVTTNYSDSKDADSVFILKEAPFPAYIPITVDVDWQDHIAGNIKFYAYKDGVCYPIKHVIADSDGTYRLMVQYCELGSLMAYALSEDGTRSPVVDMKMVMITKEDFPEGLVPTETQLYQSTFDAEKVQYTIPIQINLPTFLTPVIEEIPVISGSATKLAGGNTSGSLYLSPEGIGVAVPVQPGMSAEELAEIAKYEKYAGLGYKAGTKVYSKFSSSAKKGSSSGQFGMILIQFSRSLINQYDYNWRDKDWEQVYGLTDFITDLEAYYTKSAVPFKDKKVKEAFSKYGASFDMTFTLTAQLNNINEITLQNGAMVPSKSQLLLQIPKAEVTGGVSALYGAASGSIYLGVTGQSAVAWTLPDGPTQYYLDMVGGARVSLAYGIYEKDWPILRYQWGSPVSISAAMMPYDLIQMATEGNEDAPLTLASRAYLTSQSTWMPPSNRMATASLTSDTFTAYADALKAENVEAVETLKTQIFPASSQTLAQTADGAMMLILLDDGTRDSVNRTRINYAVYDGESWSEPEPLENSTDQTGDFNPSLAAFSEDLLAAAWIDLDTGLDDSSNPAMLMANNSIAVSQYSTLTDSWTAPQKLMFEDYGVNLMPKLSGSNGSGMLVWIVSESTDGTTPSGEQKIVYARYDGSAWESPKALQSDLKGVVFSTLAMDDDGTGFYAYAAAGDNQAGLADQIYIVRYDGMQWGSPIAVTNDLVENANPQAVYVDGKPMLIWWADGSLHYCDNLETLEVYTIDDNGTFGQDFTVDNTSQHLTIIGAGGADEGRELFALTYDALNDAWGQPTQLTTEASVLRSASAVYTADDQLVAVFNKDNLKEVSLDSDTMYKTFDSTDLCALKLRMTHALSIITDSLTVLQGNAMPGSVATLAADIENKGVFTETEVAVSFYDGNPDEGGKLIGTKTVDRPLNPGEAASVQLDWQVPDDAKSHEIFVIVDPEEQINLINRSEAAASFTVVVPDINLKLESATINSGMTALAATVQNTGGIPLEDVTVLFSAMNKLTKTTDDLYHQSISLDAGETKTVIYKWSPGQIYFENGSALVVCTASPDEAISLYNSEHAFKTLTIKEAALLIDSFPPFEAVPVDEPLAVSFSDLISINSGDIALTTASNVAIPIQWEASGSTLSITPDIPLDYETAYVLHIGSSAVTGQYGNNMAEDFEIAFTTASQLPTPMLNSFENVSLPFALAVPYTDTIQLGTEASRIAVYDSNQNKLKVTAVAAGRTLTLRASGLSASADYTVYLPSDALQSETGDSIDAHTIEVQTAAPQAAAPQSSQPNGKTIPSNTEITLSSATSDAVIYYTLDGTNPTTDSDSGNSVTLIGMTDTSIILKAVAVSEGYTQSKMTAFTYTIGTAAETPVQDTTPIETAKRVHLDGLVSPAAGGTVRLGDVLSVEIPPGAINGTENVQMTMTTTAEHAQANAGYTLLGDVYSLSLGTLSHYQFNMPLSLTFHFDASKVPVGEKPVVCWYDEANATWVDLGGVVDGNSITIQADHFSAFAVMRVSSEVDAIQDTAFIDIESSWAKAYILQLATLGIVSGYSDGTFKPDGNVTRAEFVTMLVKGLALEPQMTITFNDMKGNWAEAYVATAAAYGIASGVGNSTFSPDSNITREQMASMIMKAVQSQFTDTLSKFKDGSDVSTWAKAAVEGAVASGFITGFPDGSIKPLDPLTRAQAATVIIKLLQYRSAQSAGGTLSLSQADAYTLAQTGSDLSQQKGIYTLKAGELQFPDRAHGASSSYLIDINNCVLGYIAHYAGDFERFGTIGGYDGDGASAALAGLDRPNGVAYDNDGNLYIADTNNHVIREIAGSDHMQWGMSMIKGNIYTIAGNHQAGYDGDGTAAVDAMLNQPSGLTTDPLGNLYVADTYNNVIRMIAAQDQTWMGIEMKAGFIYTIAGHYSQLGGSYSGDDRSALLAGLRLPTDVEVDSSGNVYIADMGNSVIRQLAVTAHTQWGIEMQAGAIYTIAGNYAGYGIMGGYAGDGANASMAALSYPHGLALDASGNLYIADSNNNVIRMVSAADAEKWHIAMQKGAIYTIVGDADAGGCYGGDGGSMNEAFLNYPMAVAFDAQDNLYVADSSNHIIRMVANEDDGEHLIAGHIYAVAGNPLRGGTYRGDGSLAPAAGLNRPTAIAISPDDTLSFTDTGNNLIRTCQRWDASLSLFDGCVSVKRTVDAILTVKDSANEPVAALSVDFSVSGNAQIVYADNVSQADGTAAVKITDDVAETVTLCASIDGQVVACADMTFWDAVFELSSTAGDLLKVTLTPTTATASIAWQYAETPEGPFNTITDIGTDGQYTVKLDDLGLYFRGVVTGTGSFDGTFTSDVIGPVSTPAPALNTTPNAFPGTNLAETRLTLKPNNAGDTFAVNVSQIDISTPSYGDAMVIGDTITMPFESGDPLTNAQIGDYVGVYELNEYGKVMAFSKIALQENDFSEAPAYAYLAAGSLNYSGDVGDWHYTGIGGPANTAGLDSPYSIAFDESGNLYIASSNQHVIDVVPVESGTLWGQDVTAGHLYTIAGDYSQALTGAIDAPSPSVSGGYSGDGGLAVDAWLNCPRAIAFDAAGNLYFADQYNHLIRMVAVKDQTRWGIEMQANHIYTVAGNVTLATNAYVPIVDRYSGDGGSATAADLAYPSGIAIDAEDNLYIADTYNHLIRMVAAKDQMMWGQNMQAGNIYTVFGTYRLVGDNPTGGYTGDEGPAVSAAFDRPTDIAIDRSGNILIADSRNDVVRMVPAFDQTIWNRDVLGGNIYTVAGNPNFRDQPNWWDLGIGDGGLATSAMLDYPSGVAFDEDDNLYIMDEQNWSLRVVPSADIGKWGVQMTTGCIYTVAGNMALQGGIEDGSASTEIDINTPSAMAVSDEGDLYFANYNYYVYAVTAISRANSSQVVENNGDGTYTVTVTLKDGIGKPLSDRRVVLTDHVGIASITSNRRTTDDSGKVVFTVSGTQDTPMTLTSYAGAIAIDSYMINAVVN
jgi:sugar lactone lactonase YvrE